MSRTFDICCDIPGLGEVFVKGKILEPEPDVGIMGYSYEDWTVENEKGERITTTEEQNELMEKKLDTYFLNYEEDDSDWDLS